METKIISIDISPEKTETATENAGVMWEHNATTLVFNIHNSYVGGYRYYLEYRSLIGTKVRTEYLELNTETNSITYNIPITMSSLGGVECYFNIVSIDDDGNTVQVIKPHKFCLQFDYSPDTDNSLAKVNDFSVNALLEAIRLGTFKGDKGDKGDTGEKGDKGDKGEIGEVSMDYATSNFANTIKKNVTGKPIIIDDASPIIHSLEIKTKANELVCVRGKNLIPFNNKSYNNGKYQAGQTYTMNGVSFTVNDDGSIYAKGTSTGAVVFPLLTCSTYTTGVHTVTLSGSPEGSSSKTYCLRLEKENLTGAYGAEDYGNGKTVENADLTGLSVSIVIINGTTIDAVFYPMLQSGNAKGDFVSPVNSFSVTSDDNGITSGLNSVAKEMCVFTKTNANVECVYNQDTASGVKEIKKDIEKLNYRLITSVTLEEDTQIVTFTTDMNGEKLSNHNLRKFFILFMGSFANTNTQPLYMSFNGGGAYQMYQSFSITADKYYGFWLESEKIIDSTDMSVFKSIYPTNLLNNFTTEGFAQGLSGNNADGRTDLSIIKNGLVSSVKFGCFNSNNMIKSGSKIYLFGV
ncbi:MAG: hypothetical protein IKU41_08585 [Clostridia bacterium]|nr:hypothetical protein [Clostridia bacterium]